MGGQAEPFENGKLRDNVIFNADCIDGMSHMPAKSVDLIVTDPPYLINYKSNRRVVKEKFDRIQNDKNAERIIQDALSEYYHLDDDSAIYMFCSWHHIEFFKTEFEKYFNLKNILIWNKNNHGSGDLRGSYAPKYEMVLFGHKGRALFQEKRVADVIDCAKVSSSKLDLDKSQQICWSCLSETIVNRMILSLTDLLVVVQLHWQHYIQGENLLAMNWMKNIIKLPVNE